MIKAISESNPRRLSVISKYRVEGIQSGVHIVNTDVANESGANLLISPRWSKIVIFSSFVPLQLLAVEDFSEDNFFFI